MQKPGHNQRDAQHGARKRRTLERSPPAGVDWHTLSLINHLNFGFANSSFGLKLRANARPQPFRRRHFLLRQFQRGRADQAKIRFERLTIGALLDVDRQRFSLLMCLERSP